jgi:phage/plasmid-associated DNA primase
MIADGKLCFSMDEWKRYNRGVWSTEDDVIMVEKLAVKIAREAGEEGVKYSFWLANQIVNTVKRQLAVSSDIWDKKPNLLACRNCTLDLETFEPIPHDPEHYLTAGTPNDYDPDTTGENWDIVTKYVIDNMGQDVYDFLQEYFGYTLTAKTDAEIMLFFVGARGAGKSTIIEGAEKMHGPDLFLSNSLAGLQSRFGRQRRRQEARRLQGDDPVQAPRDGHDRLDHLRRVHPRGKEEQGPDYLRAGRQADPGGEQAPARPQHRGRHLP